MNDVAAYYNEIDPKAAAMLRQLIIDGIIAPGDVDERSIEDVRPDELFGYTQCHFFAGIGGWSVALRLAGWPDDRPVWTGSCPCQPFSAAGKGDGFDDERHLWPAFEWLISQCRPARVFGEQVERAIVHGWWDDVATDLEGSIYACAAEVLPACSVGLPHRRDRLWFVADANSGRRRSDTTGRNHLYGNHAGRQETDGMLREANQIHVENAESIGWGARRPESEREQGGFSVARTGAPCGAMAYPAIDDDCGNAGEFPRAHERQAAGRSQGGIAESCGAGSLGDSQSKRGNGRGANPTESTGGGFSQIADCIPLAHAFSERRRSGNGERENAENADTSSEGSGGLWIEWVECPDGKSRPIKSGIRLLANGLQHRAPILHAFGNAIVPQVAAQFILAAEEAIA